MTPDRTKQLENIELSKLHPYSLGVVIFDKELNNRFIKVYPIEKIPSEGIEVMEKDKEIVIVNAGTKQKITLTKERVLTAEWLPFGNYNRLTAPDVRKGDYVLIHRFSNTDKFYWTSLYNDITLRKEERIVYAVSAKPNVDPNEQLDNMYYLDINSKNKYIRIHTTDKYNEYCTYDLVMNLKEGYIELVDGKGNSIKLDSSIDKLNIYTNTDYELTTGETIVTNTKNETKNIIENLIINLDRLAIQNSTFELIDLLIRLIETIIAHQHVGNLGIPTWVTAEYRAKFQSIIDELQTMKIG